MTGEALSANDRETIHQIVTAYTDALQRHFGDRLVSVILYGSVARGEATSHSDIDILIVADDLPSSRRLRNRELVDLEEEVLPALLAPLHERGIYVDVSTKIKTSEEAAHVTPFYLDLTEDAVILFDRDGFFAKILDRVRRRLDELGAQRLRQGTVRYWNLKPDYRWGEVFEL